MRKLGLVLAGMGTFCLGMPLAHAVTTFDTALTSPPGVYFGSGNPNIHWTVDGNSGVELGLEALIRFLSPITPTAGTGTYVAPIGSTTVPGKTGSTWGFAFSINTLTTGLSLVDTTATLTLTDVANGTTGSFSPYLIPDNAHDGTRGVQNGETLSFASVAGAFGDPGYNVNQNDIYILTLALTCSNAANVFCASNPNLGSVTITVDVGDVSAVPEPLSIALFGLGLAGLGVARSRKPALSEVS